MKHFKHLMYVISSRGLIVLAVLVLAFAITIIYFITTGFSQTESSVLIGIATISTFLAAISSVASLIQATELQRIREDQTRPYVLAYFDTQGSSIIFVIENIGNSPAINLTIKFNPPPIDFQKRPLNTISIFERPISFLAPGKSLKQFIHVGFNHFESNPEKLDVSLEYSGTNNQLFTETYQSDLGYLKQATVGVQSVEQSLVNLQTTLKEFFNQITSMKSILVETPDEREERYERVLGERANDAEVGEESEKAS